MQLVHDSAGLPSPKVMKRAAAADQLGTGFIMQRSKARLVTARDFARQRFARARPILCAAVRGVVAAAFTDCLAANAELSQMMTATKEIADLEREYRSFDWPRPVFELALRWLRDHDPGPSSEADAGAWRFPLMVPHYRSRWRACGAGLGARAFRRPHGGSGLDLVHLALWRDRQAGRRLWLARGAVCWLRGGTAARLTPSA